MKYLSFVLILLMSLFGPIAAGVAHASIPYSFADIIDRVSPAVVNISSTQLVSSRDLPMEGPMDLFDFFERELGKERGVPERKRKAKSLGSGFIISADGYIVTNYHVVESAEEVEVMLSDGSEKIYKAKVTGKDKRTDLALIKIETSKQLPYLQFGDSEKARVGDVVLTIGSPFGLSSTATAGIISAKARYLGNNFDDYIQTDAAINRGNSGGPMLNVGGEVIGINTIILSPSGGSVGIGFAIPANIAKPVLEQLKQKGQVLRGWLGVRIQPVNEDMAQTFGKNGAGGALVAEVTPGSPAASSGIQVGDIITKLDGAPVVNSGKLSQMIGAMSAGQKIELEVFRNRAPMVLKVTIGKMPPDISDDDKNSNNEADNEKDEKNATTILGMRVRNIDDAIRKKYNIANGTNGVVVLKVLPDSPAYEARIRAGDVIIQINQQDKVASVNDLKDKISSLQKRGVNTAALLVANGLGAHFVWINLKQ
ncbi:MAG: Do family serine endopeptidase [Proteobacteria bacterium]|nr:Do family serine endopeptidase [Pseudomonadota bacterium]